MDFSFVGRTLRTTGAVSLLVLLFGTFYFGFVPTLSVFTGMIWGIVNLYFLAMLVRAIIKPGEIDKVKALILIFVKFPLLYFSGYLMIVSNYFLPLHLLAGFTSVLVIIVLKAIGRVITKQDNLTSAINAKV